MIIAVDGPSASGKGSVSRRIAAQLGLPYLDTGLLYRAVARDMLDQGLPLDDEDAAVRAAKSLDLDGLDDPRLRERRMGEAASRVAASPAVREALLELQRDFAHRPGGAVLDGRDIGTVVCPGADVKLYITASAEERAHRRYLELRDRGEHVDEDEIYQDILKRDHRDQERSAAPLRKADDAHLLDTTNLDIEQAFKAALGLINAARAPRRSGDGS
ncbi:(d)CMP kinase [Dichotomicrobium thermohalophilum]|uniref:Cytidylate kinase n=1 Tax=Dichotomicrobium thermohalophilum TaxID=933063 RepID=A0A397PJJ7_9HYPH|nr:(d)CMP kinase [Dichotomicrobium thermohalophilum]RIA47337.1 cytidylate kinase [Dichotomicrobium thermohalophilum]